MIWIWVCSIAALIVVIVLVEHIGDAVAKNYTDKGNEVEPERFKDAMRYCVDFTVALCLAIGLVVINMHPLELFLGQLLARFFTCLFPCHHSRVVLFFALLSFVLVEMLAFLCYLQVSFPVWDFDLVMLLVTHSSEGRRSIILQNIIEMAITIIKLNIIVFYQVRHHFLVNSHEEEVIKFGDDDQSKEVHDDIQDSVVCREYSKIDGFCCYNHKSLSQTNRVSLGPASKLVWVATGVLHAIKTLLNLTW